MQTESAAGRTGSEGRRRRRRFVGAFTAAVLLHAAALGGAWPPPGRGVATRPAVEVRWVAPAVDAAAVDERETEAARASNAIEAAPPRPATPSRRSRSRAPAASTRPSPALGTEPGGGDPLVAVGLPSSQDIAEVAERPPGVADAPDLRRVAALLADAPEGERVRGKGPAPASTPATRPAPEPEPAVALPSAPPPGSARAPESTRATSDVRLAAASADEPSPSPSPLAPAAEHAPMPHYRTRVPPSITLRYDVRRGLLSGVGEIAWRSDAAHYELRLDFRYAGLTILQQTSTGGFDTDGLAPLRFVDQRVRRAAQAANFRRDAAQLSYSGSDHVYALAAGTQDRLSWMVQLAAIVDADPALAQPGRRVTMAVTGARGDLDTWTFRSLGPEPLDLRPGRVQAVKFTREPRDEHDLTINAWLDPARHHLPVAAFQQAGANDEAYELRLIEAVEAH